MWAAELSWFFILFGVTAGGGGWEPLGQPYFDNSTKREATAAVGQPAYLHCRVWNLADRAVSWIRKRDLHILTVGVHTYSSDARFAALHADGSDEWTLRVAPAQPRDSGVYECQVSTEPKISLSFRLTVVVSKAEILTGPELFVRAGSDINLTCVAKYAPDPPSFIYWYRGEQVVNYAQRGGISVETEQRTRTSRLLIARAAPHDSGNYTCAPSSSDVKVTLRLSENYHPLVVDEALMNHFGAIIMATQLSGVDEILLVVEVNQLPHIDRDNLFEMSFIYWYRGEQVVNYAQRGGISVETEQRTRTSRLLIARAAPHDSGNYTCAPSSSESASVIVHVLSGERPAAMQSSSPPPIDLSRVFYPAVAVVTASQTPSRRDFIIHNILQVAFMVLAVIITDLLTYLIHYLFIAPSESS